MRWQAVRRIVAIGLLTALTLVLGAVAWTRLVSAGHVHEIADAPAYQTIIVFGAQLAPSRTEPLPVLRNRLLTTAKLMAAGKATHVLVSGDNNGTSGPETDVMKDFLVQQGVPADRISVDPSGLDTFETCTRAKKLYGTAQALLVTQDFHLYRAVAICRSVGLDADGVLAGCDGCDRWKRVINTVRDWLAAPKAVAEVASRSMVS